MFSSLRVRLTAWYTGIFGLVMVFAALGIYGFVHQALYAGVEDGAKACAHMIDGSIDAGPQGATVRKAAFEDAAQDADLFQGVAGIDVLDPLGNVIARYGAKLAPPGGGKLVQAHPPEDQLLDAAGNPLWVHTQDVVRAGHGIARIRILRNLSDLDRTLGRLAMMLVVWVPAGLVLTSLVGVLMAGKVMEPIQAAFEHQKRFTADASHELRTPLAIIQAQLAVVVEVHANGRPELTRALEPVLRASRRMAALVNDLLFLARHDDASQQLERTRLDLDELVEAAIEEHQALAASKGLALELTAVPAPIHGDPQRLHQLIANLIDNAIKYTDAGSVRVVVTTLEVPRSVSVSVTDTGPGIPPAQLEQVFDRFYRADAARSGQKAGTGLGLAIARAIAEAHGGELVLVSEPGRGTEAKLTLPRTADHAERPHELGPVA
jgi:signal transduction histidine kinase